MEKEFKKNEQHTRELWSKFKMKKLRNIEVLEEKKTEKVKQMKSH